MFSSSAVMNNKPIGFVQQSKNTIKEKTEYLKQIIKTVEEYQNSKANYHVRAKIASPCINIALFALCYLGGARIHHNFTHYQTTFFANPRDTASSPPEWKRELLIMLGVYLGLCALSSAKKNLAEELSDLRNIEKEDADFYRFLREHKKTPIKDLQTALNIRPPRDEHDRRGTVDIAVYYKKQFETRDSELKDVLTLFEKISPTVEVAVDLAAATTKRFADYDLDFKKLGFLGVYWGLESACMEIKHTLQKQSSPSLMKR